MTSILVALLAAGESRRMGSPKLCLPWHGTTVVDHLLTQWRAAGAENLLVIHPPDPRSPVVVELDRLGLPATQRAATVAMERGMMGSVVTAAERAVAGLGISHLVIALGDQPHLRTETLRALLTACATAPDHLVRIVHAGQPGHPLALPAHLLSALSATPSATLRDFLVQQPCPVLDVPCPDSGVLVDLDTPEDYAQALPRAP